MFTLWQLDSLMAICVAVILAIYFIIASIRVVLAKLAGLCVIAWRFISEKFKASLNFGMDP